MKKVAILQHRLLHYRTGFFDRLHAKCLEKGISLHLVHGQPTLREEQKRDTGSLPWADEVRNHYVSIGHRDVLWQSFPAKHRDSDLVVVMQENRLLSNYPWLFSRGPGKPKVAYWGHGRNLQSNRPSGLLESWKRLLVGRVDWWFAYTDLTREILLQDGYPGERISVLNNAIDNESFQRDLAAVPAEAVTRLRNEIGADDGARIGLFCGSLWADKRLDFMLAAADHIHKERPGFRLIVIGDGPAASIIRDAAVSRPWLKWAGARRGEEKAAYFRLADVVFNPGAVGLHVLDAFSAGIPMVTTGEARHGPEVAYLFHGENGLIVSGTAEDYARAVLDLLADDDRYLQICKRAREDAARFSLENMVSRFVEGIVSCLDMPKKSGPSQKTDLKKS